MFFLIIICLIVLSAWFSGMEIALFSLSRGVVKDLVLTKARNAQLLDKVLKNPQRLLIVILIGNNLVNISAASLASFWATQRFQSGAIGVVTGIMTLLILIFGEMLPKAFFQTRAEKMALLFVPIIYVLQILFYPIIILLERFLSLIVDKKQQIIVSERELKAFSRIAVEKGVIPFEEHEMIMNILRFSDTTAKEVMTPRYRMSVVNDDAEVDQVAYFMAQEGYSRYPAYHNQEDNIVGYVHVIDVMKVLNSDQRENRLVNYLKPIIEVDESIKIDQVFRQMLKERAHMALVYRQGEQLLGLVTLEDVLEEIVGEIEDENDQEIEEKIKVKNGE